MFDISTAHWQTDKQIDRQVWRFYDNWQAYIIYVTNTSDVINGIGNEWYRCFRATVNMYNYLIYSSLTVIVS